MIFCKKIIILILLSLLSYFIHAGKANYSYPIIVFAFLTIDENFNYPVRNRFGYIKDVDAEVHAKCEFENKDTGNKGAWVRIDTDNNGFNTYVCKLQPSQYEFGIIMKGEAHYLHVVYKCIHVDSNGEQRVTWTTFNNNPSVLRVSGAVKGGGPSVEIKCSNNGKKVKLRSNK